MDLNEKIKDSFFNTNKETLPTINKVNNILNLKDFGSMVDISARSKARHNYTDTLFPIISDEIIKDIVEYCKGFNSVSELMCGTGWISHWLKKYGMSNLNKSVDDKSWGKHFKNKWLDLVTDYDAVEYVRDSEDDCFIMSWPYMDSTANLIWEAMKPGQTLIYIGEDCGGCTADSDFFQSTRGSILKDDSFELNNNFRNFFGIHDRIIVYKKW